MSAVIDRVRERQRLRRQALDRGEPWPLQKYSPDQDRDDHGRWSAGGGGVSGKIADLFSRVHAPDGGFTYQPQTGVEPKEGYAVSPYPERSFAKDVKDFSPADLRAYAKKNADVFKDTANHIGAWHDPETGKVYLDVSVVSKSPEEAAALAGKHDQIAYFDLKAGKSVTINRSATSGGQAGKYDGQAQTRTDALTAERDGRTDSRGLQKDHGPRADAGRDRGTAQGNGRTGLAVLLGSSRPEPAAPVAVLLKFTQDTRRSLVHAGRIAKIHRPHKIEADGKWKVVDDDGHVYGTHDSEQEANRQLAALYAAKGRGE